MNVLVINCGSSSVKFQVLEPERGAVQRRGVLQRIGEGERTHRTALAEVLESVRDTPIDAVGHRVVHGGDAFHDAVLIDADVIAAIEACTPLAPLHNPANLAGIRAARELLPDLPHVAVFDTAFHARLPRRARTYAIDTEVAERHGIRRHGFHGTSHAYVAREAARHLDQPLNELRLVSCHLGNGASACAIEYGHSVDTSMGLTPLEGLVMGTRSGDLDPGAVLRLVAECGVAQVEHMLNRESGLLGLSGQSNDMRDLLARAAEGDDRSRLAIAVFTHRVRKYIGAYAAAMGGIDAVILTGGIGENSASVRQRILQRFEFLGLRIDEEKNLDAQLDARSRPSGDPGDPGDDEHANVVDISAPNSRVRALVIATDEELMIARQTAALTRGQHQVAQPSTIPIAISARHIHLDRATLETLFGPGAELTVHRELSQPGQFASQQCVTLIGPRGAIEQVRILGPLRGKNQVEVSRTDEFRLGVDAPVRRSGHVEGSAPIILEGPAGRVSLREGLICARRHIHMTPEDAEAFGVEAGDEVEVAITGGERDLIFGDVLVRVKSSYRLEMHIDTDEANAAELSPGASGQLTYTPAPHGTRAEIRRRRR